ncbi:MAG: VWA domain-containing protein [Thermoanaerobaculaceae bacterium]
MSWTDPGWLWLAAAALLALPAIPVVARWRSLQQARLASRLLWLRWLGGVPATGAARLALWLLAAAAAAIAAAGPGWGRGELAVSGLNIAVALDVSASMRCADVQPDRLSRATAVLRQVIGRMPKATWAVAAGAGTARACVPLTSDVRSVAAVLAEGDLDRGLVAGSNLAGLLSTAGSLLELGGPGRTVLVVSDGEELEGDAAGVADALRRSGIAVVALATGTASGGPVPRRDEDGTVSYLKDGSGALVRSHARPDLLGRLCTIAGNVVDASSPSATRDLVEVLRGSATRGALETVPVHSLPFGLAAALLATASFMLWPWRRGAFAVALLLPGALGAAPPPRPTPSAWHRVLPGSASILARRAASAMERGAWSEASRAYAEALALRRDDASLEMGWATAAALAGEEGGDEALAALAEVPESAWQARYNLGTVRLARGDAAGAVETLRQAVATDPEREESWHNLELALAACRHTEAGEGRESATVHSRGKLVEAAARAALAQLPVRQPVPAKAAVGREW